MQSIIKIAFSMGAALFLFGSLSGCNAGGGVPVIGNIDGPDTIEEFAAVEFSISVTSGTNITFQWSCDPPGAGGFDSPALPKTGFTAAEVTADTGAEIRVVINADQYGPVIKTKNITILDVNRLIVSEIIGPGEVDENTRAAYNIAASGDTGITYEWSLQPPGGASLDTPAAADTILAAGEVPDDTPVELKVVVGSDNYTPITRTKTVTIIDSPGWARTWGGDSSDLCHDAAIDSMGNIYTVGYFHTTVDFDPGPGIDEHSSYDESDIFLSKFDSNGEFQWARTWGGDVIDTAYAVCTDDAGSIYVTGTFFSQVDFDPGPGTDIRDASTGDRVYLSKFDTNGEFQWALNWGGRDSRDVAADNSGAVYVIGAFLTSADLEPGPGMSEFQSKGGDDVYISKFDSNGNYLWSLIWGGAGNDYGYGCITDDYGNAYFTGEFQGQVDFNPGDGTDYQNCEGTSDVFLSKLDPDGGYQWARTWGGIGMDWGRNIAVDSSGNLYVTGWFAYTVNFDPGSGSVEYTSNGSQDIFLSKFNADGHFQWARAWGSSDDSETGWGVVSDGGGNVYVAGYFHDTVDFDPGDGEDEHTSNGDSDICLSKFSPDGDFIWARTWGGMYLDHGRAACVDGSGNVYFAGTFHTSADFNPGDGVDIHDSNGSNDAFLSMLPPDGTW